MAGEAAIVRRVADQKLRVADYAHRPLLLRCRCNITAPHEAAFSCHLVKITAVVGDRGRSCAAAGGLRLSVSGSETVSPSTQEQPNGWPTTGPAGRAA